MRDLAIDPLTGDLATGGGDLHHVDGLAAIRQRVWIRLRLFLGEWFLNNQIGADYYGHVLVKNPDLTAVEALLKETILGTEGVTRITRYGQVWDEAVRRLSVNFTAETAAGELQLEGVL